MFVAQSKTCISEHGCHHDNHTLNPVIEQAVDDNGTGAQYQNQNSNGVRVESIDHHKRDYVKKRSQVEKKRKIGYNYTSLVAKIGRNKK